MSLLQREKRGAMRKPVLVSHGVLKKIAFLFKHRTSCEGNILAQKEYCDIVKVK
jgi:hypothetical protein